MISIKPEHAINILNGKKTLELRTWIPKGYVGWVYVYVTKGKPYLVKFYNDYPIQAIYDYTYQELLDDGNVPMNGKVTFRFWFDEYDVMEYVVGHYEVNPHDIPLKLCLDIKQINDYGKGKDLYAWHIKQLEVFDTPKMLSEFYKALRHENGEIVTPNICNAFRGSYESKRCLNLFRVKRAPQKCLWVYVKELENER